MRAAAVTGRTARLGVVMLAALAALAGLAHAVSFALPGDGRSLWWLQMGALALLAALVSRSATAGRAAWAGAAFSLAWFCGGLWWLHISMHVYGGMPALFAAAAVFALALYLGLYTTLACALWVPLAQGCRRAGAVLFAALWLLAELARGSVLTGFPWIASGYAHVDGPLAASASWFGVYGVGALSAGLAMAAVQPVSTAAPRHRGWRVSRLLALGLLVGLLWLVTHRPEQAEPPAGAALGVTLLQGNVPQEQKFEPARGVPQALAWYQAQLRGAATPLVVAPETAIALLPAELPAGYWASLQAHFSRGGQAALIGLPLGSDTTGYTNSVAGLKPEASAPYRYDKYHLVPFGEFIPWGFRWFTRMMNMPLGDFNRGALAQPPFEWQGQRLAPNICYEDLFGEELAVRFADPAQAPTMFVNVSNIAWFGDTVAIDQHLAISRMRAIEFGRPMLRATNTGATAAIDHRGRVIARLPRLTQGALVTQVHGRTDLTPYALWVSRHGLWPLWGVAIAIILIAMMRRSRGPRE